MAIEGVSGVNEVGRSLAGLGEDVGELRDDVDMGDILDDANGISSGGQSSTIEAPEALDPAIYCDYYNIFGLSSSMFLINHLSCIILDYEGFGEEQPIAGDTDRIKPEGVPIETHTVYLRFLLFFSTKNLVAGMQTLLKFDWDWKKDRTTAPMDQGKVICCRVISILTLVATHIIFSGKIDMQVVDSTPLGSVPRSEIDPVVSMLTAHKHIFEATVRLGGETRKLTLLLGCNDFCCLFQVKVPVSLLSFSQLLLYS
jgi:hypothetical protein